MAAEAPGRKKPDKKFGNNWRKMFKWLRYDEELMFCTSWEEAVERGFKPHHKNNFATTGNDTEAP